MSLPDASSLLLVASIGKVRNYKIVINLALVLILLSRAHDRAAIFLITLRPDKALSIDIQNLTHQSIASLRNVKFQNWSSLDLRVWYHNSLDRLYLHRRQNILRVILIVDLLVFQSVVRHFHCQFLLLLLITGLLLPITLNYHRFWPPCVLPLSLTLAPELSFAREHHFTVFSVLDAACLFVEVFPAHAVEAGDGAWLNLVTVATTHL